MNWVTLLLNRLSKEWTVVSKEEAQKKPYFGFRGWLLLFYLLTVWGVIQNLIVAFASPGPELIGIFGGNPDVFGGNSGVMRSVFLVQGVVVVPFLVLAPLRHSLTPKVWIGGIWISVIVFAAAVNMPGQIDAIIGLIAFGVVSASLMTWYVLHSKRVNVTYLNRVPAKEAPKQFQSVSYEPARRNIRIFWVFAGIFGVILLIGLLQFMTSP